MNMKKPATLSDSLLQHRPRKGQAAPQSEAQASKPAKTQNTPKPAPEPVRAVRRRRRRSENTIQINMKDRPEVADRFTAMADEEDLIFCDLLEYLMDEHKKK